MQDEKSKKKEKLKGNIFDRIQKYDREKFSTSELLYKTCWVRSNITVFNLAKSAFHQNSKLIQ